MFHRCNNLFNKQSNEKYIDNLNHQKDNYLVKPNDELPLVDILKSSKSERQSNKATKECIKKSKSLKVAKMDGKINIIKKYSRFQSGDAAGKFEKDSRIIIDSRQVCPNYQVPLVNTVAVKKKVRFASVCSNITNCLIPRNQKKESNPVIFLFENKHFKKNNGKLCSCCGRVKRKTRKAVTFNNSVVLTSKISKPVKQTMALQEIRKRHKLPCPRCFCRKHKSVMDRSMLRVYGKKDGSSVFGHPICNKEAETRFAMIHLEANKNKYNYETTICPVKTKKKAPALEYIYIRPQRKNNKNKQLTEPKICDKIHKGKKIKKLCKANKKHVTNRMKKCKDTFGSLLVTKPILGLHKLGVPNVKAVLPLHRVVFIPRYIYHNFQPYLRGPVRVSKNLIKRTKDGPVAAILKRFKLRLHAVKFIFSPVKVDIVIVTTQSQVEI
ncbi:uncharacterized protein LOC118262104 [Spodoptera frugiperda]|uniref:Uncharacterized protein LOC118262104 n=1 Tax=Spodoptera frugiperda TaxID=7108 RepID=A0A9R0CTR3_SPOFR|nr:uncharacterized protein LOC118262104 [Spodoptera frugiperda]